MSGMMVKHDVDVHAVMEQVFKDGVIIDLNVYYWKAIKSNTVDDLGVKKEKIPGFVAGLGTKRLLEKKDVYQFARFEGRARHAITRRARRFPISQTFFVPVAVLVAVEEDLTKIKKEFDLTVVDFLRNYERRRKEYLARFPEHRARLEKLYPPKAELEGKFLFTWTAFSITMPRLVKRQKAEEAALTRYQQALEERMSGFLSDAVSALRTETVRLCNDVVTRMEKGELITNGSLERIKRHIDRFKTLNFVGDAEVESRLEQLKAAVGSRTSETFKTDEAARDALVAALAQTRKVAEVITDVNQVTGEYRRRIKA